MNVEYVSEQLEVKGAALEAFSDVFARFQAPPESSAVRIANSSLCASAKQSRIDTRNRPLERRGHLLG